MTTVKVVIGASHGDEGKGEATDYFANQAFLSGKDCIVVLSNGGSQRGHTVTIPNGRRHVFRHFGSGTFAGAETYLPKQYILNPMNFVLEARELGFFPVCHVHPDCLVSTPFDMIANQIIEDARGDARHGSCGVGIWETILRNGLSFKEMTELFFADDDRAKFRAYLTYVRDYFLKRLSDKRITINSSWNNIINSNTLINNYIYDFMMMYSCLRVSDTLPVRSTVIFENGQGLLLDQNIVGYGKNTTPSNTGLQNPAEMIRQIPGEKDVEVCYVSRTYTTRHGAGRFDTEYSKMSFHDATNQPHPYQGTLRFGVLDTQGMIDRCVKDFETYGDRDWKMSFMLTHTNEVSVNERFFTGHNLYLSDSPTRESITRLINGR